MGQMIEFERPDGSACRGYLTNAGQGAPDATPEVYRYDADHAFFNERRPEVYDATCAKQVWECTLAFLAKNLA